MQNLNLPLTAEEDHADRVFEAHRDCGCEGVADPCECFDDCPHCADQFQRTRTPRRDPRGNKKARQYRT